jgi:hypothetical protein
MQCGGVDFVMHYLKAVGLSPFFSSFRSFSFLLTSTWTYLYSGTEFSDILWHPTKIYSPKVFLLTKINPENYSILYNLTHFPGPLVWVKKINFKLNKHYMYEKLEDAKGGLSEATGDRQHKCLFCLLVF